jgi:hypothetical protein
MGKIVKKIRHGMYLLFESEKQPTRYFHYKPTDLKIPRDMQSAFKSDQLKIANDMNSSLKKINVR